MNPDILRNIVLMGYGNIGQALSPLLRQRFPHTPVLVIDECMEDRQVAVARAHGFEWQRVRITRDNFESVLGACTSENTLLVNVATSISSRDVISWAQSRMALYLDTCIDPWEYQDGEFDTAANTNYGMREAVMDLQAAQRKVFGPHPTALVAHGANPGFVSVLVKEALQMMASRFLGRTEAPALPAAWGELAEALGIRVIQVSERDWQHTSVPRHDGEFVNTWSVEGFVAEALQPVELGWGSHEASGRMAPMARSHPSGSRSGVYFKRAGGRSMVRSWTPQGGDFEGRLISHNEAFSIADFLSVRDQGAVRYRPTVYYAYRACDQAMDSLELLTCGERRAIEAQRVLKDEIEGGIDELGVLLISDRHPSLWLGSQLSVEAARAMAPHNNATSLQVVGSMMAGIEWMMLNPHAGIVESEALDHGFVLEHARKWWEPIVHEYRVWQPDPQMKRPRWTLDEFWLETDEDTWFGELPAFADSSQVPLGSEFLAASGQGLAPPSASDAVPLSLPTPRGPSPRQA